MSPSATSLTPGSEWPTVPDLDPIMLGIPDVVELTRLSRPTIERRIADGTIPSVKVGARRLIPYHQLVEAMERLAT